MTLDFLLSFDLRDLFVPTLSPLESVLRMSVVYLFLFLLLRGVLRRELGELGIGDLLVVVLVADAMQNAMADDYRSITDGLILVSVLVFWNWVLSYASMRWRTFRRILRPAPVLLVRDGQPIWPNLSREHVDEEELLSQLRLQGLERLDQVKYAFMEADGEISILRKEGEPERRSRRRKVV